MIWHHAAVGTESAKHTKLHRRSAVLDGRTFTIVSPRPSSRHRFATNRYHETWHVLSDVAGAHLIARLFWWLSYQRKPNTVVVIDGPLLVPNPFDADPSAPIVVYNTDHTHLTGQAQRDLTRSRRRLGPPEGTVRLHVRGLQDELAKPRAERDRAWQLVDQLQYLRTELVADTERKNGPIVIRAHPDYLRWWALHIHQLGWWYRGTDSWYLERLARDWPDGEIQIFQRFASMVRTAVATRNQLLPGEDHRELLSDERAAVWAALPEDHGAWTGPPYLDLN